MANPWKDRIIEGCREVLRFTLWSGIIVNGLMALIFCIVFFGHFLLHSWDYCKRVIFSGPWG